MFCICTIQWSSQETNICRASEVKSNSIVLQHLILSGIFTVYKKVCDLYFPDANNIFISPHGQGGLVCCDSWGRKESDMTE